MAYVITTFFAMGMGYVITETTLGQGIRGVGLAWAAFAICAAGTIVSLGTALTGNASVLYTFYPPIQGHPAYYFGVLAVVVGSWIWCGLMVANMLAFKRRNESGHPVPLAMFAIVATAFLWFWASLGVAVELVATILPQVLGFTPLINAALARTPVLHHAARHRLFLADAGLHRLLHAGAAGGGRAALLRHDGPADLHPVPRGVASGRDASFAGRPGARHCLEVSSSRCSPPWWCCRRC